MSDSKMQAYQAAIDAEAIGRVSSWQVFEAAMLGFAETYRLGQERVQVILGRMRPMTPVERRDHMNRLAKMLRNQANVSVVRTV